MSRSSNRVDSVGAVIDSSESDRNNLDDIDLLNLRVSFASKDKSKSPKKVRTVAPDFQKSNNSQFSKPCYRTHHCGSGDSATVSKAGNPDRGYNLKDTRVRFLFKNTDGLNTVADLPQKKKNTRITNVVSTGDETMSLNDLSIRKNSQSRTFPFKVTPSGNFKVDSKQVVFESKKLSVLVADPQNTKVNIQPEEEGFKGHISTSNRKGAVMNSLLNKGPFTDSLGALIASTQPVPMPRDKEDPAYREKRTSDILEPELNLDSLGYLRNTSIQWNRIVLPEKTNLYMELFQRITNYRNTDCKVYIANDEFNCHLLVLQCYSEVFDGFVAVKKVELPPDKVTSNAFTFIYDWMITGEPSYTELNRENILEVLTAAKYLKIKDLMEQCWAFIDNPEVFYEDTAFALFMDAKPMNMEEVRELMIPRIQKFFLTLVSSSDWITMDKTDVTHFLKSNYISINCEMEVFMAAIRWLKHDWSARINDVEDVMSCVRFGHIAPWQLVDIKRNPENPEFLKVTENAQVCKMIDDGSAFVIIKYWYGQENDDFQHWNNVLGLHEPAPRNWTGAEKTYFTYRDFLITLDHYKRKPIKSNLPDTKSQREDVPCLPGNNFKEKTVPTITIPTIDEFLAPRKSNTEHRSYGEVYHLNENQAVAEALKEYHEKQNTEAVGDGQKSPNQQAAQEQRLQNTRKMFSPSQTIYAKSHMNRLSQSVFCPNANRDYTKDTSLFLHDREAVLVLGGIDPHNSYGVGKNTGKDIFRYFPDNNVWEYVGDLPEPRHHHSTTFFKGRVYLCGGADPRDDDVRGKSIVVDTVWSFEPVRRMWFSEGSLTTARKNFGLVTANMSMYAIGGQDKLGRTLASVERYNADTGSWEEQAGMLHSRMGVACTKYRNYIFAAGGMTGDKKNPISDSVEAYDVSNNQWSEIASLRFPRCFGCLFTISDRLFLIGGAGKVTEKDKTTTSLASIDCFNAECSEWQHQTDMAIPRHGHAVAYLGTQILIIGGTWVRGIACLPTTLSGHATVTLPPSSLM